MNNSNNDNIAIPAILKNISPRTIIIVIVSLIIFAVFANIFKNIYSDYFYNIQLDLPTFSVLEDSYSKINMMLE